MLPYAVCRAPKGEREALYDFFTVPSPSVYQPAARSIIRRARILSLGFVFESAAISANRLITYGVTLRASLRVAAYFFPLFFDASLLPGQNLPRASRELRVISRPNGSCMNRIIAVFSNDAMPEGAPGANRRRYYI